MQIVSRVRKFSLYHLCIALLLILPGWNASADAEPIVENITKNNLESNTKAGNGMIDTQKAWDHWHAGISHAIAAPVNWIDHFFADESLDEENQRTRLHTSIGFKCDEEEGLVFLSDFKLRLAFPRLENRLQLFIDETIKADEPDEPENLSDALDESEPGAGLRFIFSQDEKKSISTDFGARFGDPVQFFGRLRGRMTVPFDQWTMKLSQTLALFTEDGWTETSEMRWDRPLDNDFLFRSLSRVTWEEKSTGITPLQSLILFKKLSARKGYNVALNGKWPEFPHTEAANYSAILTYRQQIFRPWLFLEVSSGVDFPQVDEYEHNGFFAIKLEIVFSED